MDNGNFNGKNYSMLGLHWVYRLVYVGVSLRRLFLGTHREGERDRCRSSKNSLRYTYIMAYICIHYELILDPW